MSRQGLYGFLYAYQQGTEEELRAAFDYIAERHDLTGTVYARKAQEGVLENHHLPARHWLFELVDPDRP